MAERKTGSAGNRGFGDKLVEGYDASAPAPPRVVLPTDSVLSSRSTTLSDLAAGKVVTERTMWVPAQRCRPWVHHNRDQALLDADSCADLIDSFKSEGRQKFPGIVRRLREDPDYDYEIIAGVRRHWTVAWLNAHNYPGFEFLVTVQALTDEEAFRVSDVENRARQDLTDLERARDYLKALDLFYAGQQSDMAARLNIDPGWLSRLLALARLPGPVLDCFVDRRDLKVEHAKQLAPLLRGGTVEQRLLAAAGDLALAQQASQAAGEQPARAADVVRQLCAAAIPTPARARSAKAETAHSAAGRPMLRHERRGKGLRIDLLAASGASRGEIIAALTALLERLPTQPFG